MDVVILVFYAVGIIVLYAVNRHRESLRKLYTYNLPTVHYLNYNNSERSKNVVMEPSTRN